MDYTQVRTLAEQRFNDAPEALPHVPMFSLLVAVADAYVEELERDNVSTDPIGCAIDGLTENLEILRHARVTGTPVVTVQQ